ncbi:MAG: hypothetical protein EXS31_18575 [Pedosphaera sp.]|nr:hypothetical protein [Pedosphaera sp.]
MKRGYSVAVMGRNTDPCWQKSRIAARLLLKREKCHWTPRDRALAEKLAQDPGVTNRLIDQAVSFLTARRYGYRLVDAKH